MYGQSFESCRLVVGCLDLHFTVMLCHYKAMTLSFIRNHGLHLQGEIQRVQLESTSLVSILTGLFFQLVGNEQFVKW